MQFFTLLFVPAVILSVRAAVTILGSNEGYIEGKSRWIWMARGENGPLSLVDLHEPADDKPEVDGSQNHYWLFTRSNKWNPDILVYQKEESVHQSHIKKGAPVIVIAHGWRSDGTSEINTSITSAFLETFDVNVIVIDWKKAASLYYTMAVKAVPSVGEWAGKFLNWLMDVMDINASNIHLIGHSLGAHVVGNAARALTAQRRAARVTGLDPAGPMWMNNPKKLNTSSGVYVDTINTDGKTLGYFYPLGHSNFYPNRGMNAQPGCWISPCSHSRAYLLFAATVRYNHKIGKKCKDIDEAAKNACQGEELHMGNTLAQKRRGDLRSEYGA